MDVSPAGDALSTPFTVLTLAARAGIWAYGAVLCREDSAQVS